MKQAEIKSLILGMVGTNCYFIINKETKETLIIDPADDGLRLSRMLEQDKLKPVAILLTHGHFDHIMAVNDLKERYGLPVYAHETEQDVLMNTALNMSGMIGQNYTSKADVLLKDGEELCLAGFDIRVLHTPGHTKGSVCYYLADEGFLMSGDTLFCGSIGRTDFPTGSMSELIRSVREKLFVLPGEVKIYPGHQGVSSIGFEMQYNPFF